MRTRNFWPLAVLGYAVSAACGGGGGAAPQGGPIPLATNALGTSTRSITYSVAGTYTDSNGTRPASGTSDTYRIADQYVHSVLCTWNSETTTTLDVVSHTSTSTTRSYGFRDSTTSTVIQAGARLESGDDVYYSPSIPIAPLFFVGGVHEDFVSGAAGYDTVTNIQRWGVSEVHWRITGTAYIQTPLGNYECFVVSWNSVEYDYFRFFTRTSNATAYVRPEIGTLLLVEAVTLDNGSTMAQADLTYTATSYMN